MNYYAPSVRLMNDGLNSSGNMIDATTAVNGLAGNIRYYGVDDSNLKNYIYFNCSDYSNQTSDTCETWRIIGIVDGKIKIIRNNKIEDLAWDYDKNTDLALESSSNNWENSSLQILLNQSYYNGDTSGEITYYSKKNGWPSDEEVETVLDMNNIGIKNSETRNLISNSIWYLGGYNQIHSIYANDIYTYERTDSEGTTLYSGNPFSLEQNIGIMYASDYSYASDLNLCKEVIDAYSSDTTNCTGTNWLYNGDNEWTITQNPGGTNYAVISISIGNINNNGGGGDNAYILRAIRPTIYLISELNINKLRGDGSINDPYNIVV